MKLRTLTAFLTLLTLSLPVACTTSVTSELLDKVHEFYTELNYNEESREAARNLFHEFNAFYEELETFNNTPDLDPTFKSDLSIWNPVFEYDPFEKETSFRRIKLDPQIRAYVRELKAYRNELMYHYDLEALTKLSAKLPQIASYKLRSKKIDAVKVEQFVLSMKAKELLFIETVIGIFDESFHRPVASALIIAAAPFTFQVAELTINFISGMIH